MTKRNDLERRVETLLAEAKQFYDDSFDLVVEAVEKARSCGERLIQLKAMKRFTRINGSWEKWLQANWTERSVDTARRYMQVAREWNNPKLEAVRECEIQLESARQVLGILRGHLLLNPETHQLEKKELPPEQQYHKNLQKNFNDFLKTLSPKQLKRLNTRWDRVEQYLYKKTERKTTKSVIASQIVNPSTDDIIKINTPIKKYKVAGKTIFVKREDMCTQPPGPPFSKCRGLYKHLERLKAKGITTVGYAESRHSMAGWGIAWMAKMLDMKTVIFEPQFKNTPELLKIHREKWKEFGAKIIPAPPKYDRTKSIHGWGVKELKKIYPTNSEMIPIALGVEDMVNATAEEWRRTMDNFKPDVTIIPVGSGTIFAGIIKSIRKDEGRLIGVMCYDDTTKKKSDIISAENIAKNKLKDLYETADRKPKNDIKIINPVWRYQQKSNVTCPFPCHPFYDLKAWQWLVENINTLEDKILFWNIGSQPL